MSDVEKNNEMESIDGLFNIGKRNYICENFVSAVEALQKACELGGKEYGEMSPKCADIYYYYGISLLDLARTNATIFGDGLSSANDNEDSENNDEGNDKDEEKREEESEANGANETESANGKQEENLEADDAKEVESANGKKEENVEANGANETESANGKQEEKLEADDAKEVESVNAKKDQNLEANDAKEANGKKDEPCSSTDCEKADKISSDDVTESTDDSDKTVEAEVEDDYQVAWEVLDLARRIYHDMGQADSDKAKEIRLREADCYFKLAEISLETEKFDQCTMDLLACLDIQTKELAESHRLLAATCQLLGIGHRYMNRYEKALQYFKRSAAILQACIDKLKTPEEPKAEENGGEKKEEIDVKDEIASLSSMLEEVQQTILDTEEEGKMMLNVKELVKEQYSKITSKEEGGASSNQSENGVSINDISSLVKRKRKISSDDSENPANGSKISKNSS